MTISDSRFQIMDFSFDPISSLSAAGKFAYMVRLRKGEKSFKRNLAHTPTTSFAP
jgi:hypothetical protein